MVVIEAAGGLGNQLQQYAFYRKVLNLGAEARLDLAWFSPEVQETAEYRRDSDKVARFMEERLRQGPEQVVRASLVYAAYTLWCKAKGHYAESSRQFRRKLQGMGMQFVKKRPSSTEGATEMLMGYALTGEMDDLLTAG